MLARRIRAVARAAAAAPGSARTVHMQRTVVAPSTVLHSADRPAGSPRKLVLLLGWVNAREKHLAKYAEFYHERGFDTLSLLSRPGHVLRPATQGVATARALARFIETQHRPDALVVHGFSVGAYMFSQMLRDLWTCPPHLRLLGAREPAGDGAACWAQLLRCQIFDSPVDFQGIPGGIARATTDAAPLQLAVRAGVAAALALRPESSRHYRHASAVFHGYPAPAPTLCVYSDEDPVTDVATIEEVMLGWAAAGVDVTRLRFDTGKHVQHWLQHADAYRAAVNGLLQGAGCLP